MLRALDESFKEWLSCFLVEGIPPPYLNAPFAHLEAIWLVRCDSDAVLALWMVPVWEPVISDLEVKLLALHLALPKILDYMLFYTYHILNSASWCSLWCFSIHVSFK